MQRLLRESRFAETWQIDNPKYHIEYAVIGKGKTYFACSDLDVDEINYVEVASVVANSNNELCFLNIYCEEVKLAEEFILDYEVEPYTYYLFIYDSRDIIEKLNFKPISIYVHDTCKINDELLPMCISYNREWYENENTCFALCNFKSIIDHADNDTIYAIAKRLQRGEPITMVKSARR